MGIYLIADPHFNHNRIIEYCDRPFNNLHEMNMYIIDQWNSVVTDDDVVYILGDFGFGSVESLTYIVNCLNGYKILIMGNHDRRRSVTWWYNFGFNEVHKKPITIGNIILSHEPQDTPPDMLNYHGHIHNIPLKAQFNPENHICVSVECIDYKPVLVEI